MNRSASTLIFLLMLGPFLTGINVAAESTNAVSRITQQDAKSLLGNPEVIFIDVRAPKDWNSSGSKIKGAVREDPSNISGWADKYPEEKTLLFYCA